MHIKDEMSSEETDSPQNGSLTNGNLPRAVQTNGSLSNGNGTDPSALIGGTTSDRSETGSAGTRNQEKMNLVEKLIEACKETNSIILDLSRKHLNKVPDQLLMLSHLEYLYLEGNSLSWLPENFFDCFPSLIWLDLRNNFLQSIPSAYIGRHKKLKNLLLQGNQIRSLPLELGLVRTLTGLSLSENPIEFPPQEVLDKGCQIVLAFLREMLKAKSQGHMPQETNGVNVICCEVSDPVDTQDIPNIADLRIDSGESSDDEWGSQRSGKNRHRSRQIRKSLSNRDLHRSNSIETELIGLVPHSASLQRRTSYGERKSQHFQKLKKSGSVGSKPEAEVTSGKKKLAKLSRYPEPPPPERVENAYKEAKRLAKIREMKEKQEMVLQRRRDQEALKEWRDEGKKKQIEKYRQKMIKGKLDYEEPAKKAPFGIEEEHLKVMTNKERIAQEVREKHEKMRRVLSPGTQQKMERIRMERDRELERRLKEHTTQMQERRRQPKGTPQEEMAAAKRELEIAEQLRKELEQRRKNLEYRFTAFTGDTV